MATAFRRVVERRNRHRSGYIPARSSLVNRMSCVRSILGHRSFYRKSTMMLGYPMKLEKKFWSASTAGDLRKKNRTSSKKVWSNRVIFIVTTVLRRMRKSKNASTISPIKPEIRTWYAFEGPLGDVIHNKRFFFAWKEGCLMGTYNTLDEATASLTSKQRRDIH